VLVEAVVVEAAIGPRIQAQPRGPGTTSLRLSAQGTELFESVCFRIVVVVVNVDGELEL
jgi:hypothetical protein